MKRLAHTLRQRFVAPLLVRWRALLYLASEWESLVARPGAPLLWRKRFLCSHRVNFRDHVYFGNGLRFYKGGCLTIGKNSCFGENCGLYIHGDVAIGDGFVAAPGLTINSGDHDPETLQPKALPILIGHRVWCGVNVTILGGSKIGDDCVIGANSLVKGEISPSTVVVGSPARVVRKIERTAPTWGVYGNT